MAALKVQDLLFNPPLQERQGIRKEIGEIIHLSTSAYDVRWDSMLLRYPSVLVFPP